MNPDVSWKRGKKKKKTEIKATNLGFKYQDKKYNILTQLIFSNLYSAGGSVRVKEDIEHWNYFYH